MSEELAKRGNDVPTGGQLDQQLPGVEFPKDGAFWPSFLTFLSTPSGQEVNKKLAEWMGAIREGQKQKHVIELMSTTFRYLLMAGIIGAAVKLQGDGHLDTAITGLLGLALGYLFGRQRSQE